MISLREKVGQKRANDALESRLTLDRYYSYILYLNSNESTYLKDNKIFQKLQPVCRSVATVKISGHITVPIE